jgi:hypothetical protein
MKSYVLFCVEWNVANFLKRTTAMSNADYTLGQVVSEFVEYRKNQKSTLNRYSQYGPSIEDQTDGMIMYLACEALYIELNKLLNTNEGIVTKAVLGEGDTEMLVEFTYEDPCI